MSLGDRMKENYENRYRIKLTRRTPVIIRLDGKAFHTVTKNCHKPFDQNFMYCMKQTAEDLCEIQGVKCAYTQSDEISLLLTDFDNLETEAWFDYNLQKMVSVAAGIASVGFTYRWLGEDDTNCVGIFDARAFNIPKEEVCNYFIWRQQDCIRNSVQMLAQHHFSHQELNKKSTLMMKGMLKKLSVDWDELSFNIKYGYFLSKLNSWKTSSVIFLKSQEAIEDLLKPSTKGEENEQKETTGGNREGITELS